jgi:hypothetical protein
VRKWEPSIPCRQQIKTKPERTIKLAGYIKKKSCLKALKYTTCTEQKPNGHFPYFYYFLLCIEKTLSGHSHNELQQVAVQYRFLL